MDRHLEVTFSGDTAAFARIVARAHSVGAQLGEVHLRGALLCLTVGDGVPAERLRAVLARLVDVNEVGLASACTRRHPQRPPLRTTTYVPFVEPSSRGTPSGRTRRAR